MTHDEANKKLQSLDSAINDVQNWERRLLELQDWIIYMDKYLSTRIDQDIFADDVPDDFVVGLFSNIKHFSLNIFSKRVFFFYSNRESKRNFIKTKLYLKSSMKASKSIAYKANSTLPPDSINNST
jgi:hypothetical protein